jgi:cell division protein FtsW
VNRYVTSIILLLVLLLTSLGLVMISSTSAPLADASSQLKRQLLWFGAGLVAFGFVGWMDYRAWRPWCWVLFILSILMLCLVFVPGIGSKVKGASRWINLLFFKIQPSEFLRITLILLLAHYFSRHQTKLREWKKGLIIPICIVAVPAFLLLLEPDMGSVILLAVTLGAMMFVAGVRIMPLVGLGVAAGGAILLRLWLMPERRARLLAFLNPEEHKEGKYWQIWQGMVAFGSGGTRGLGLGNSRQKAGFVPESTTDSIFPIIGEELGMYVTIAVVIAYILILVCGLLISMNSQDAFGMLLAFGIVFGLIVQAIVNIGTVTGSIPPKGMPLPFVSYGGSNLMICYIGIGFLLSIHRHSLHARRFGGGMSIDNATPRI